MATTWIFINSTWTAGKHPAESPYGEPLSWGVNAFQTLAEAVSYAKSHSLSDVQFVDYDKSVLLTNANNFVKKISAKEIEGTKTEKTAGATTTYTEESKQSGSGKLSVGDFNQNAALGNFKEVEIVDGTGKFTVTGGNNNVKHVYTSQTGGSFKDSGTVTGKADGTLTIRGGSVTSAVGAWAAVQGPIHDYTDIATHAEALQIADPGYPADPAWGMNKGSVLSALPGYATVTVTENGDTAKLNGGTVNFTHLTDVVYSDSVITNITKSANASSGAAGKLTINDGAVDSACRYATVDVYNGGEFGNLEGGVTIDSVKMTYKRSEDKNNITSKMTCEHVESRSAAGTFTAHGLGDLTSYKRDVEGYAKVTVKDTTLGDLDAANEKFISGYTSETVTPKGLGSIKSSIATVYTSTYAAGGTLVSDKAATLAKFGDISGFGKVELTNATVKGNIEVAGGGSGRPGSVSTSDSAVSSGTQTLLSKFSGSLSYAAAGTVTLNDTLVTGMIAGAATVKLADTTVSSSIIAGKESDNWSSAIEFIPDKKAPATSDSVDTRAQKYNNGVAGTLTMNGGKLVNAYKIEDFATVTLDKVGGSISYVSGFSSSIDNSNVEKNHWIANTSMATLVDSKYTESTVAAGNFTATGKSGLTINYIYGANKATLTDLSVKYGIFAGTSKEVSKYRTTVDYDTGATTVSDTITTADNAAGTLLMKGGALSGYISGYKDVTLDAVAGTAVTYIEGGSNCYDSSSSFSSGVAVSAVVSSRTVATAAGALVMKNCNNMKISGISGFAKVEIVCPIVSSSITGGNSVETTGERETLDAKTGRLSVKSDYSRSDTLVGSAVLNDVVVSKSVVGFANVVLDNGAFADKWAVGESRGNVTSTRHEYVDYKGATSKTGVLSSDYLEKYSDTAVGTLRITDGASVGNAAGVKTATLYDGGRIDSRLDMQTLSVVSSSTLASNAKTGLYESKFINSSRSTAVGSVVLSNGGEIGAKIDDPNSTCLAGAAKLTATYAHLDSVDGYNHDSYLSNCTTGTIAYGNSNSFSSNAVGNYTLAYTTAGTLYGAATVKLTTANITGAKATNFKMNISYSSAATKFSSAYSYSNWAAGNFTAGKYSQIGAGGVSGYQNVTMTDGAVTGGIAGGKYVNTLQSSWTKDSATGPSRTFASTGSQSEQALGKATLTKVAGVDAVRGYATVVLDQGTDVGRINDYAFYDSKYDHKVEYDTAGSLTKQTYSNISSSYAKTELTLKNGAVVANSVDGVKTLNVSSGCKVGGQTDMSDRKQTSTCNITSNAKTHLYEEKIKYDSSLVGVGTVNVTDGQVGNISGAAKVTATDAVLGDITAYNSSCRFDRIAQGTMLSTGIVKMIDPSPAVLLSDCYIDRSVAAGQATLTRTTAGRLIDVATVKLTSATVEDVFAGSSDYKEIVDYKNGKLDHKLTEVIDVAGTLTATSATFTGTGVAVYGYANVTLTDCTLGNRACSGGRTESVSSGVATGANYGLASAALVDTVTKTASVAGKFTATRSTLGTIVNYASVTLTDCTTQVIDVTSVDGPRTGRMTLTLNGSNTINGTGVFSIRNVAELTVKSGKTTLNKTLGAGNADCVITVNAKAELVAKGMASFGSGVDTLNVNGTLRLCGSFNTANLDKLSGSGLLALTTANCKSVLDAIKMGNIKKSGNLEIVAAGEKAGDVLAIRTKKEELADNTAKTAGKYESGTMNGWLSAEEAPELGKFADTEDWVSFKYEGGSYKVTLTDNTRYGNLTVELWRNGGHWYDIAWNNSTKSFNLTGLAVGTDYQVHLAINDGQKAMSYALTSTMG